MVPDMRQGRDSDTLLSSTDANGSAGGPRSRRLMELVRDVCDRLPAVERSTTLPVESGPLDIFLRSIGPRHCTATLDNFEPPTKEATKVLQILKDYASHISENIAAGIGILLFGPTGTGKDHLLVGLGKKAGEAGHIIRRITGPELFRVMRDAMSAGSEARAIESLKCVPVLILSDPLSPIGALTAHQAAILYEVVDARWQRRLPIWCSLNVASAKEADERLGASIIDRLQDDALILECQWASHRRPALVVTKKVL